MKCSLVRCIVEAASPVGNFNKGGCSGGWDWRRKGGRRIGRGGREGGEGR